MRLSRSSLAFVVALLVGACGPASAPEPTPDIDQLLGTVGKADGVSPYLLEAVLGESYRVRFEEDDAEISPLNARFLRFELEAGQHLVAVARKADGSQLRPHLQLYWQKEALVESEQQALLPMAADGDAALAFTAPADGLVALYVADRHRNLAGTVQVDLVEMSTPAPVALPEGVLDARRQILELARLEADVTRMTTSGLLSEVLDGTQAALYEQSEGVRPGDLYADLRAYQRLAEEDEATLKDWAVARNLAAYATEVRRRYYASSVAHANAAGDELIDAYGAYCAQLWQTMRSSTYLLRSE